MSPSSPRESGFTGGGTGTPTQEDNRLGTLNNTAATTQYIGNTRKGRTFARKSVDLHPEKFYGDTIHEKQSSHLRIFFQNVKGLSRTTTSDDYRYYSQALRELQVDICGLAETNKPWTLLHHRQDLLQSARSTFGSVKVAFASPTHQIDPIRDNDNFQAGGCVTMAFEKWVPSVHGSSIPRPKWPRKVERVLYSGQICKRANGDHRVPSLLWACI